VGKDAEEETVLDKNGDSSNKASIPIG